MPIVIYDENFCKYKNAFFIKFALQKQNNTNRKGYSVEQNCPVVHYAYKSGTCIMSYLLNS